MEEEKDPTPSLLESRLYPPPGDAGEDEVEGQGYQDDGTAVPVALVAQLEKRAEAASANLQTCRFFLLYVQNRKRPF